MGRFLTKDSYDRVRKSNPQSLNQYAYCNNNPINNVDPNGDSWFTVAISTIVSNVTSAVVSHSTSGQTHSSNNHLNTLVATDTSVDNLFYNSDDWLNPFIWGGAKGIHTDYDLKGNKYLHHKESDLRFNKNGEIVEHNGRIIGPASGYSAKILQYLKNVRPKFFLEGSGIYIFPPGWKNINPGSEPSIG